MATSPGAAKSPTTAEGRSKSPALGGRAARFPAQSVRAYTDDYAPLYSSFRAAPSPRKPPAEGARPAEPGKPADAGAAKSPKAAPPAGSPTATANGTAGSPSLRKKGAKAIPRPIAGTVVGGIYVASKKGLDHTSGPGSYDLPSAFDPVAGVATKRTHNKHFRAEASQRQQQALSPPRCRSPSPRSPRSPLAPPRSPSPRPPAEPGDAPKSPRDDGAESSPVIDVAPRLALPPKPPISPPPNDRPASPNRLKKAQAGRPGSPPRAPSPPGAPPPPRPTPPQRAAGLDPAACSPLRPPALQGSQPAASQRYTPSPSPPPPPLLPDPRATKSPSLGLSVSDDGGGSTGDAAPNGDPAWKAVIRKIFN